MSTGVPLVGIGICALAFAGATYSYHVSGVELAEKFNEEIPESTPALIATKVLLVCGTILTLVGVMILLG